ncbi:LysR family transcriptional regulator [Anaerotruncus sp. 1XD42-93]|uniref:winged helix-turn-helix domain-containing protein n=1 Tax=Anaerotruncus sp. 1XD42-93 TaxID=2320853 RepID=UPI000EA39D6B|nr:LysR family transcriptional regulator [Anaerotruncus sp. 1XD42-93]NBK19641.1 LysR family transcriptional regulator [Anaerotruncus sp. 1XD42-93]RKJ78567.1 LysR family transcriptional regulator [Anaerotruncus sp. 1XD22-93]
MDYQIRVKLKQDQIFFGPGVARLLRGIEHTGSLQAAAAEMGMSYSKAWRILHTAERELGFLLVHRRAGGNGGGSSQMTDQGQAFLERYERFEREVNAAAERLFADCFDGFSGPPDLKKPETGSTDSP